ncbi:DMT family transporter [Pseudoruegeria sp. SK021]|uniref:DMT family transporter n=1 Tax=Pseudoruegeria sp. SK021 TaxID=1933035 RepID=UPI000A23DF7E|nr:DMT family transporter [Pseudoruegeria sp. SK021]OSP54271.1 EamA family transporter [Pseudoruegeria sp. SK021]
MAIEIPSQSLRPARPVVGILWMLVTGLLFVGVQATVKAIGPVVPAAEAAFLRYLLGLVLLVPMLPALRAAVIGRRDWLWFCLRAAAQLVGVIFWFYAMTQISLAEVTAMNYLAPIYVTLGAALFLGEGFALRRLLAVVAALVGALIILRPGFREIGLGHLAMLVTGLCFGVSYLIAKSLSERHGPEVIVGLLSIMVAIGLAPFALADWVTPSLGALAGYFLVAVFATGGHYAMTLAFRAAPVTVTQPVVFLQLVWAVLMGAVFFAEPVDGYVVLGGGMIIAAISFITWREARLKRRTVTPTPMQTKS